MATNELPHEDLSFDDLRAANTSRNVEWCKGLPDGAGFLTMSFRGCELAGEAGEAVNVIKKLERQALGLPGSRATRADLADELADVVICADLCAMDLGIDLAAALARKFNATSEKLGFATRLMSSAAATRNLLGAA